MSDKPGHRDSTPTTPPRRSGSWPDPETPPQVAVIEAPDVDAEYKALIDNAPPDLKGSLRVQFDMIIELRRLIEKLAETHRGVNKLAAGSLKLGAAGQKMAASVDELTATMNIIHEEVRAARSDIYAAQDKIFGAMAELLRQFSHVLERNAKALEECVDAKLREHVVEHHTDELNSLTSLLPPDSDEPKD